MIAGRGAAGALMRGDFEQSEKLAQVALSIGQRIRADNAAAGQFGLEMFVLERERGRLEIWKPLSVCSSSKVPAPGRGVPDLQLSTPS